MNRFAIVTRPHCVRYTARYHSLTYRYPVERLWSGGSYGNMTCFARTDRLSNLDGLWHASTNEWLCGRLDLTLEANGQPLTAHETSFYPGHQATTLFGDGLQAERSVFVPYGGPTATEGDTAFYTVLRLQATQPVEIHISCDIRWPAVVSATQTKQPERHHTQRRVHQWTEGPVLWAQTVPFKVDRWDTVLGNGDEVRALLGPPEGQAQRLETTFSEPGRARLVYTLNLGAGEEAVLPFVLVAGAGGVDSLRERLTRLPGWQEALAGTVAAYDRVLGTALLVTPDARINRGLQWAKANTVRVQHRYRHGTAFTNDPPQDIVVVRDCAWYGMGADWLTPDFTDAMYTLMMEYGVHDGGKLTEYIHADTSQSEDYALNINDDTPLFVMGALHHYAVTGDPRFLERVYPVVRQACDWILAQRRPTGDGAGLVWCTAQGADVWGNATWRNIIPGYRLAGAVTEINALCYAALRAAADLAHAAGQEGDARRWTEAAKELRAAINTQLSTGDDLYLLNKDEKGTNPTRTADLVFPLLGEVADPQRARHILDLLYGKPFYTPYGIHTVARDEAEYHPDFGFGLMGGLWPNLTAWVAYAGRRLYPDRLAEMTSAIYALSEMEDPLAAGHSVPGEFPEWFDGETWQSRGMAMSPWMPPTYLWLGIEGLAGVAPSTESLESPLSVNPNLPPDWGWLMLRNLPYRGRRISFFVHDGHLHATYPLSSTLPQTTYARDVTDEVEAQGGLLVMALEGDTGTALLVAAPSETGAEGVVSFRGHKQAVTLTAGKSLL